MKRLIATAAQTDRGMTNVLSRLLRAAQMRGSRWSHESSFDERTLRDIGFDHSMLMSIADTGRNTSQ